jgi:hypothetical protein
VGREGCYRKVDCPLHSRSPSLSTRGILRESDILVYPAASVLVSTGDGARSKPAPFPFVAILHPFTWQLTSTCNERLCFSPARRLLTCREQAGVPEPLTSACPPCAGLPMAEAAALSFVTRLSVAFMWWPGVAWTKSTLHTGRSLAIYDYINSDVFLNITFSMREKQQSPDRTSFYLTNLAP